MQLHSSDQTQPQSVQKTVAAERILVKCVEAAANSLDDFSFQADGEHVVLPRDSLVSLARRLRQAAEEYNAVAYAGILNTLFLIFDGVAATTPIKLLEFNSEWAQLLPSNYVRREASNKLIDLSTSAGLTPLTLWRDLVVADGVMPVFSDAESDDQLNIED